MDTCPVDLAPAQARSSTPLGRRQRAVNSKYWRDRADLLWRTLILKLEPRCAVTAHGGSDEPCSGHLNAHHLVSRAIPCLRHERENGITLCVWHHTYSSRLSPHAAPLHFSDWMEARMPARRQWERAHRWDHGKADYRAACYRLARQLGYDVKEAEREEA